MDHSNLLRYEIRLYSAPECHGRTQTLNRSKLLCLTELVGPFSADAQLQRAAAAQAAPAGAAGGRRAAVQHVPRDKRERRAAAHRLRHGSRHRAPPHPGRRRPAHYPRQSGQQEQSRERSRRWRGRDAGTADQHECCAISVSRQDSRARNFVGRVDARRRWRCCDGAPAAAVAPAVAAAAAVLGAGRGGGPVAARSARCSPQHPVRRPRRTGGGPRR